MTRRQVIAACEALGIEATRTRRVVIEVGVVEVEQHHVDPDGEVTVIRRWYDIEDDDEGVSCEPPC